MDEYFEADQGSPPKAKKKIADVLSANIVGDEFIEASKRVVVLGGPGAGKTTFLKYLALAYIDKNVFDRTSLKTSLLPFFVPLPLFNKTGKALFDFLVHPIKEKTGVFALDFLKRLLNKENGVILLDSLDEVPREQRRALLGKIKDFCQSFPNTKIVLSCRTADYTDALESFSEVEVVKLERTAVRKIIHAWFESDPEKAKKLCEIVDTDKGVASLTETPLLLSLLCIQFRHDLSLPKRKVELFKRCSETLLRDWDTSRQFRRESLYESLTDQAKEKLFEVVAYSFSHGNLSFVFPKAKVLELIADFCTKVDLSSSDAAGILLEVDQHHGILEQFAHDLYSFSHTSFQEYFAARAIVARSEQTSFLTTHIDEEDYFPIIEFIVSLADEPSQLIDHLIRRSDLKGLNNYPPMAKRTAILHLLYRCLATGPYLPYIEKQRAVQHLIDSQFEIARIYRNGNAYPMSQLIDGGIRHPYFRVGSTRPSLLSALQPFKKLSNEILKTPVSGYADAVFQALSEITIRLPGATPMLHDAVFLNLLTPLSRSHSNEVKEAIEKRISERGPTSPLAQIAKNTLQKLILY